MSDFRVTIEENSQRRFTVIVEAEDRNQASGRAMTWFDGGRPMSDLVRFESYSVPSRSISATAELIADEGHEDG